MGVLYKLKCVVKFSKICKPRPPYYSVPKSTDGRDYKCSHEGSFPLMREVFSLRKNSYNLRYNNEFLQPKVKTVSYGMETIRVRGLQLRLTLPSHIQSSTSLKNFKRKSEIGISLIVNAVCVDPIYHRWVFYNLCIFFSSASGFINFIVILLLAV